MKEEARARAVLVLDAIILTLGFIAVSTLLVWPSLISNLAKEYYNEEGNQLITYIYAVFLILLGILFIILYHGITKRSTGQLNCWVLTHCLFLTLMILSTVWTLASTPKLIVYHIPDLIYMCYRVVSLIIIREFRALLRTARQLNNYNVQYAMSP